VKPVNYVSITGSIKTVKSQRSESVEIGNEKGGVDVEENIMFLSTT